MTADVHRGDTQVSVPRQSHRRRGLLLVALAVFQLWLWGTRIWNLVRDAPSFSAAFVGVHLVLYVTAVGAAVVLAVVGTRMLGEAATRQRGG